MPWPASAHGGRSWSGWRARRGCWWIRRTPRRWRRGLCGCWTTTRCGRGWAREVGARSRPTTTGIAWRATSSGSTQRLGDRRRRPRADRVRRAVADEYPAGRAPLLFRRRHHGLALGVQHEHPRRAEHQTRAAPDAAITLHAHRHPPPREDAFVAGLRPFGLAVQRRLRGAVALLDDLPQMVERKHRDVLDARM